MVAVVVDVTTVVVDVTAAVAVLVSCIYWKMHELTNKTQAVLSLTRKVAHTPSHTRTDSLSISFSHSTHTHTPAHTHPFTLTS